MKICAKCLASKPLTEYHKQSAKKDGLHPWCKECAREHRLSNHDAEKVREYRLMANVRDREKNAERWQRYYQENQESLRARYKDEKGRLMRRLQTHNRRIKIAEAGTFTLEEWQSLCAKYDYTCLYPGCQEKQLTMDHVIPVSVGGSNTIDNIQPLCIYHNTRKATKIIDYR